MRRGSALLLVLVLIAFAVDHGEATEGDPKGLPPPVAAGEKTDPADASNGTKVAENTSNTTPPDLVKSGGEKKGTDHNDQGGKMEKIDGRAEPKEKGGGKKDKGLVEPKKGEDENGTGKGNSDGEQLSKAADVEGSGADECDPSNRCVEEKSQFVACLRVPGKDSLDLSLLIQNKGSGLIIVNIIAPSLVKLEHAIVKLQPKDNTEVKVSVEDYTNNTVIVLEAGGGKCSLNFQNMISNSEKRSEISTLSKYTRLSTRSSLVCVFLAAAVPIGLTWACLRYRRMRNQGSSIYQKAEMELPVSTGGKKEPDEADGWDNSWGDAWDDEESPMTPSKPIANPSLKGLASRRSNKDGWKD